MLAAITLHKSVAQAHGPPGSWAEPEQPSRGAASTVDLAAGPSQQPSTARPYMLAASTVGTGHRGHRAGRGGARTVPYSEKSLSRVSSVTVSARFLTNTLV